MTKITGLNQIIRKMDKMKKSVAPAAKPAIRKALNAGAKELEKSIKPNVPVIAQSTNFRQKGTIKNNIRHKTKVAKDGLSGYTVISVKRAKGKRMARVGENTRDRTDPFYWWMVEYGTEKMEGRHFMKRAAESNKGRVLKVTREKFIEEIQKIKF
ncbi:HK97 gp10 family phage protein [Bisgaard Taxon 10/6]|uniref:HK97-gp10 family putative phage morphogenesis protein n=1 Tax=Exercitatus varius TaxID=67857 RepID=UPI00294B5F6F|nr:HK97-gp10 family putative phage morphogenesis protein [Exercitatus varius]MDG2917833.1 HK97 gp10 family phage protein [Exercitatus varius]